MRKEKPATTICKHCKTEIPYGAKICPQCRKKQKPGGCLIAIIIVVAIGLIGSCSAGSNSESGTKEKAPNTISTAKETTQAPIEYLVYGADEMLNDLDSNALKAKEKYEKQYIELTGKLNVIDSNGKYISLVPIGNDFAIIGVQCYIKTDEQKSKVMDMAIGDTVTLKGKITGVGEVMGYSLDIDDIN